MKTDHLRTDDIEGLERAIATCMKPGPAAEWLLAQTDYLKRIRDMEKTCEPQTENSSGTTP